MAFSFGDGSLDIGFGKIPVGIKTKTVQMWCFRKKRDSSGCLFGLAVGDPTGTRRNAEPPEGGVLMVRQERRGGSINR